MKLTKKSIISIAQAALALVAILLFFAPALVYSTKLLGQEIVVELSGFQAWLGADIESKYFTTNIDASFGGVFTLILVILLILAPVATLFLNDEKINKYVNFGIIGLGIVAAIFLFCGKTGLMVNIEDTKYLEEFKLGLGASLPACLLLISAIASAVSTFLIKE